MMGGARHPHLLNLSQAEIESRALALAWDCLGIVRQPEEMSVSRHLHCIPQHTIGHHSRVAGIRQDLDRAFGKRLSVLGSSYDTGVAINQLIAKAENLAKEHCLNGSEEVRGIQ